MSVVLDLRLIVRQHRLRPNASISIAGRRLALEFRRQGSVYVLHNTTGTPSLTQTDTWHEATHPSYWQHSFVFEAELHASLSSDCQHQFQI